MLGISPSLGLVVIPTPLYVAAASEMILALGSSVNRGTPWDKRKLFGQKYV